MRILSELVLLALSWPGWAYATQTVTCSYIFENVPSATVTLTIGTDGIPETPAFFQMGPAVGPGQKASVTPAGLDAGEMYHLWLQKEIADGAVEMIVFSQPQSQGQSELINHNVPLAQDIWGTCLFQ